MMLAPYFQVDSVCQLFPDDLRDSLLFLHDGADHQAHLGGRQKEAAVLDECSPPE